MQQHPIPQNVTSYEFHLIGNMTIKQFMELGGGIGFGVFVYLTSIPEFIKWPIIILSVLAGGALAFLPFDGRPLDRVVIAFFKAVYSPTQFIWRKTPSPPKYFSFSAHKVAFNPKYEQQQKFKQQLGSYMQSLPKDQINNQNPLDAQENSYLYSVSQLFQTVPATQNITSSSNFYPKPQTKPRIRSLTPEKTPTNNPQKHPQPPKETQTVNIPPSHPPTPPSPTTLKATTNDISKAQPRPDRTSTQKKAKVPTTKTSHNTNLPFPSLPQTPNTLVGMVLDNQGKIVENAIIEVLDQKNNPVRALKTNKLGQFRSVSPLSNGTYQIQVEKDGLSFENTTLQLKGKKIPPIEIKSK